MWHYYIIPLLSHYTNRITWHNFKVTRVKKIKKIKKKITNEHKVVKKLMEQPKWINFKKSEPNWMRLKKIRTKLKKKKTRWPTRHF